MPCSYQLIPSQQSIFVLISQYAQQAFGQNLMLTVFVLVQCRLRQSTLAVKSRYAMQAFGQKLTPLL